MRGSFEEIPEELKSNFRISPTKLIEFSKSPRHYWFKHIKKKLEEPSKAMELGTAIHKAVLEPDEFHKCYVVKPKKENYPNHLDTVDDIKTVLEKLGLKKNGNKQDLINRLLEHNPEIQIFDCLLDEIIGTGKKVITEDEFETCSEIVNSIKQAPEIYNLIQGSEKEKLCWWLHEETGVVITMRLDAYKVMQNGIVAIDLKTTRDAKQSSFEKQIWNNGLFLQAAMYADGIEKITGVKCEHFGWLVAETSIPYNVEFYAADFGMLEAGRDMYRKLLKDFVECKKTDTWPSPSNGKITTVSLPTWAWNELERQINV